MVKRTPATPATNHSAATSLVADLRREGAWDSHSETLAQLALTLARQLDEGAGMAAAAISREFRATIDELVRLQEPDADDGEDDWVAGLSAPVRDPEV